MFTPKPHIETGHQQPFMVYLPIYSDGVGLRVACPRYEPRPYDTGARDGFETEETFVAHSSGSCSRTPRSATLSARLNTNWFK